VVAVGRVVAVAVAGWEAVVVVVDIAVALTVAFMVAVGNRVVAGSSKEMT
jgi:hypothetical protein